MDDYRTLSHSVWDCKYHVVFIPKCRRKTLYKELRRHLGEVFHRLAAQKESKIEEGHLMSDQVHMMLSIPPKYAVEFDASFNRALPILKEGRFIPESDLPAARSILRAAAFTYVAGSFIGIFNILRWLRILLRAAPSSG